MQELQSLIHNYVLICAVAGWFSAQLLKVMYVLIRTHKFVPERMFGPGGMPSSHSACVTALTIATCRADGFGSTTFAIAFALACVVMYDATGVRRQAGEHAKALNMVMDRIDNMYDDDTDFDNEDLKEVLGHTPLEVLAGALLGILIALIIPM
jgi:acid phosphatase family membrane protein YuiD